MADGVLDASNNPFIGNFLSYGNSNGVNASKVLDDRAAAYQGAAPWTVNDPTVNSGTPSPSSIIPYGGVATPVYKPGSNGQNTGSSQIATGQNQGLSSFGSSPIPNQGLGGGNPGQTPSTTPSTPTSTTYTPPPPPTNPYSIAAGSSNGSNNSMSKVATFDSSGNPAPTSTGGALNDQVNLTGPSTQANMSQLLQSRNPFGTSGMDIMNTVSGTNSGGSVDPRLYSYFNVQSNGTSEVGSGQTLTSNNSRMLNDGSIVNPNNPKDPFVQVGNLPDGRVLDMSKVTYDPEFGAITTISNLNQKQLADDPFSKYFPWLAVGAGIAGPALSGALTGTYYGNPINGGSTGSASTVPGSGGLSTFDTSPMPPVTPSTAPGALPTPPTVPPAFDTTPMPPVTPSTVPGSLAQAGAITPTIPGAGGLSSLANNPYVNNPLTRTAVGVGVNSLVNSGNKTPTGTIPTGSNTNTGSNTSTNNNFTNPDGSINWSAIIGAGVGSYSNNQSLQQYQQFLNQYINQSDPNYASEAATRSTLLTNPESYLATDPAFKQGSGDVSRQMAARGLTLSGNEMGALDDYGSKYISQKISDLNASMKPTTDLMTGAMRNAPEIFQAISNRNAANGASASSIVSALQKSGAWQSLSKSVQDYLTGLGDKPIDFSGGSNDPLGYLSNNDQSPNNDPENTGNGVWDGLLGSNPGP